MEKLLKIGDVANICQVSIKTLRYYEKEGLISPKFIDVMTGYRHYDEKNVEDICKIKFYKKLGFSLKEIKNFNEESIKEKKKLLEKEISEIKEKISTLGFLNANKDRLKIDYFINDEMAIGKWEYIGSCSNKEDFKINNIVVFDDIVLKKLYFLPEGRGYWIFKNWSKGCIVCYNGNIFDYEIIGDKLLLTVNNFMSDKEIILVYKKSTNKVYNIEDISKFDKTDLPFIKDENAIGFWQVCAFVKYENKKQFYNYINNNTQKLFLKSLWLSPLGEGCIEFVDNKSLEKINWTKGKIINEKIKTVSDYQVRDYQNQKYLIMDWKSGDYTFANKISGCYVFRFIK